MKALPYTKTPEYKSYLYSPEFSAAALATLEHIHVDPCASPAGQFIQADQTWNGLTKATDGLTKTWNGNVFFDCDNYERPLKNKITGELITCPHIFHKMSEWTAKFLYELESKRTEQAVGFFPARMFKNWMHNLVLRKASVVCYHTRKIQFYICERQADKTYLTRQALYNNVGDGYMTALFSSSDATKQRFVDNYSQYGTVVGNTLLGPL